MDNIDNNITKLFEDFNVHADITREDLVGFIREIIKEEIHEENNT